ncbi:Taurine dioxygenase, alpha-ketoglutarate-dependent [Pseudonocardia ammonioxydans]|uniref:Taurine dioxygenase, alpha-ketoglutarate-dependent n=1 Tax=Pseudonocardia ammonioxydans TaxID=260086 RepID=A0A1I4XZT9_PSUAM|nr:TauD/TfdA family dioxygenase [Pseudonocardia ammonioxydans]SFN31431.1 Taurine dioxygenase, alpha-ketoglutarate-dependent [Pseudonocardia ammonioxydans]
MNADRPARGADTSFPARAVRTSAEPFCVERRPGAPVLLRAEPDDPVRWAFESRRALRAAVVDHGAVLARGLGLYDPILAGDVVRMLADGLMNEREAFSPRTSYTDRVYSSTRWPRGIPMCPHHELSYCDRFPAVMMFVCLSPAVLGGATVLVDSAAVLDALPASLVRRCERDGWTLVRTYNGDVGPSWAEAFGIGDRHGVEDYCRASAIEVEWGPGGQLRTRQRRPAVVRHPITGVRCWFNEIAHFSEWVFGPGARDELCDVLGPDGLPATTCFGDGTPIGWDLVDQIQQAYAANAVREPWRSGDLLIVDNIRTAHGRDPYEGPRELLVALADPTRI